MYLQTNNSAIRTKKCPVNEIKDEAIRASTPDITREKKVSVKCVEKESSKALVSISGHFKYPASNVQAFPIKMNTVLPALHLFQISPKF